MSPYWNKSIYTKWVTPLVPQSHAWVITMRVWGHVLLYKPCYGFPSQCRPTCVIERLASVSRTLFYLIWGHECLINVNVVGRPPNNCPVPCACWDVGLHSVALQMSLMWAKVWYGIASRAWTRFQTSGSATQRHYRGRQRATTPRQDRYIAVQARRHPFANANTLRN